MRENADQNYCEYRHVLRSDANWSGNTDFSYAFIQNTQIKIISSNATYV